MRSIYAIFAIALSVALARAEIEEDGDVLVLNEDNFEEALEQYNPLLVEFYAPWCGHCKKLAPEYAKAATALRENDLRIAMVDATANDKLASKYGIKGFPTLKFFSGSNIIDYNAGRTASDIEKWVTKKSGPAFTTITDVEAANEFKAKADVTVFGFFEDLEGEDFNAFKSAAAAVDDAPFAATTSAEVRAAMGIEGTENTVVVFKDFDDGKAVFADFAEDLVVFIQDNRLPLVTTFSAETAPQIFGGTVKTHVLIMADEEMDGFAELKASWAEAAKEHRGKALYIWVPTSEDRIMSYFDVTEADLPKTVVVTMPEGQAMKKFPLVADDIEGSTIAAHVDTVLAGDAKPVLKSEKAQDSDTEGPLTVVRGSTFDDIVLNNDKDVLVEFYAPWCGHCKALAPTYQELAEKVASDTLTIAMIDGTANEVDVEGVNVRGFPTLFFFPASTDGSPKKAVEYDGSRDLDGFITYLNKHATNPVKESEAKDEL